MYRYLIIFMQVVDAIRKLREEVLSGMSSEEQEESGVTDMVDTLNPLLSLSISQMSLPGGGTCGSNR